MPQLHTYIDYAIKQMLITQWSDCGPELVSSEVDTVESQQAGVDAVVKRLSVERLSLSAPAMERLSVVRLSLSAPAMERLNVARPPLSWPFWFI